MLGKLDVLIGRRTDNNGGKVKLLWDHMVSRGASVSIETKSSAVDWPKIEEMRERARRTAERMAEETAALPPYDRDKPCPKCAFPHATTEYHGIRYIPVFEAMLAMDPARMERVCPNCRFKWFERPLDWPVSSPAPTDDTQSTDPK